MTSERDAFLTYLLIWNCQSSCCSQAVEVDQVSCTCSCPWPRRRLCNTGQHMQCVFPGVGPYLVSPQSFPWSAATFSQGSKYQAEEQANRGTAEACHFYSSICDPDPSSEGDWDTSACVCVYVILSLISGWVKMPLTLGPEAQQVSNFPQQEINIHTHM